MIHTIILNGREIKYELVRKNVKNINLRIRANGTVYVSAHNKVSRKIIEDFLVKKSEFIISALRKYENIAKNEDSPQQYISDESFRYLGKDLHLVVNQGENSVFSDGIYLNLTVKDTSDRELKSRLIEKWYDMKRKEVFGEIMSNIYPVFQNCGIKYPRLTIRYMTSRWGSCRPKRGAVTLNSMLIEATRDVIEYVVMHEFVHFLHPNHSKSFYETLFTFMPDWQQRKIVLENSAFSKTK
ncbi:MAG: M48 family metallopeptidase [Oscillospiraceae bacterium]|jgi:predicted metal-dependent hydrolase|nr:M48 family metallopeptidase [Oscillospiraceae bacterium]